MVLYGGRRDFQKIYGLDDRDESLEGSDDLMICSKQCCPSIAHIESAREPFQYSTITRELHLEVEQHHLHW